MWQGHILILKIKTDKGPEDTLSPQTRGQRLSSQRLLRKINSGGKVSGKCEWDFDLSLNFLCFFSLTSK